jgi:hypothetical protein
VLQLMMATQFGGNSSRRGPDVVTEELVAVLSGPAWIEFKPLFDLVYTNLRARKSASGGEEMLRLRAYEKLQGLVNRGMVQKSITKAGKKYRGNASLPDVLIVAPVPRAAPMPVS